MAYPVIKPGTSNHLNLTNIGVNTHATIDIHLADTSIHFSTLDGLSDVSLTGSPPVISGDVLMFSGGVWIAAPSPGSTAAVWGNITGTLSDQTDLQSALNGKADTIHTHVEADITDLQNYLLDITNEPITDLLDVNTTGAALGQVLMYSGSPPMWVAATPAAGVTDHTLLTNIGVNTHATIDIHLADTSIHFSTLDGLSDVSLTGSPPTINGDVLMFSGGVWISAPSPGSTAAVWGNITGTLSDQTDLQAALNGKADTIHTHVEADITDLQNYLLDITNEPITALIDVNTTGVLLGQVLTYSGSPPMWVAVTPTSGVTDHTLLTNIGVNTHATIDTHLANTGNPHLTTIANLGDTNITTPVNTEILTYNGAAWVNLPAVSAGTVWGTITGTLSDQPDLQTALNLKAETASNLGVGAGVFAQKLAFDLQFKSLVGGDGIVVTPSATEILIDNRREVFFAHNGTTAQTFATALITVLFPTIVRSDPAYTYNTGAITVNASGWYLITYQMSADNSGNSRAQSRTGISVNSTTVQLPGSFGWAYHRTAAAGEGSFSGTVLVNLTAGDIIRIMTQRISGTTALATLAEGCRIMIVATGAP